MYRADSSFFEVTPADVVGMSVVFHCNNGDRAFCAPFLDSGAATEYSIPEQDDVTYDSVVADFGEAEVIMSSDGSITMEPTSFDLEDIDADDTTCTQFKYGLFEAEATLSSYAVGEDCGTYVGDLWDPTHQCPDFSGSEFCLSNNLCNDTMFYSYDCDYANDRYSCAPGDLSGKFGVITDSSAFTIDEDGTDTLMPTTDDMMDYLFVIYCGNNTEGITYVACAPIEEYTDADGAMEKTVAVTLVATLIAMLF